jgi:curved DNA-binding protein CbpA
MTAPASDLRAEIDGLHAGLERMDYYAILALPREADFVEIRDAYYARAQDLHPDRFVASEDATLRERVYAIYKRVTEAYGVLGDPEARALYDAGLARGALRLPAEERSRRLDADERQIAQPLARMYFRSARDKLARDALHEAAIDVELGLSLEPASPLQRLREQIGRKLERQGGPP